MRDLLELERRFWTEASEDLYRERMADDAVLVFGEAGVLDKQQTVEAVRQAGPWHEVEISDSRFIRVSDEVTALVYRALARRSEAARFRVLMTSVCVRRNGQWQLAMQQHSPLR